MNLLDVVAAVFSGVSLALVFWRGLRAERAADRAEYSCRQAELYHDPPQLWKAVKEAEAAASRAEKAAGMPEATAHGKTSIEESVLLCQRFADLCRIEADRIAGMIEGRDGENGIDDEDDDSGWEGLA